MEDNKEEKQGNKLSLLSPVMQTVVFVVFVMVVIGLLSLISGRRSPRIPDNKMHVDLANAEYCLTCHGVGMEFARGEAHPPKDECIVCHTVKRQRKFK